MEQRLYFRLLSLNKIWRCVGRSSSCCSQSKFDLIKWLVRIPCSFDQRQLAPPSSRAGAWHWTTSLCYCGVSDSERRFNSIFFYLFKKCTHTIRYDSRPVVVRAWIRHRAHAISVMRPSLRRVVARPSRGRYTRRRWRSGRWSRHSVHWPAAADRCFEDS